MCKHTEQDETFYCIKGFGVLEDKEVQKWEKEQVSNVEEQSIIQKKGNYPYAAKIIKGSIMNVFGLVITL